MLFDSFLGKLLSFLLFNLSSYLESELDFYAVDADRQESFLKAYPEFTLPTRFSELDQNLKIPDRHYIAIALAISSKQLI